MKRKIVPFFFPYAGCTSRCAYCNQWGMLGEALSTPGPEMIERSLRQAKQEQLLAGDRRPLEAGFFGGTFTGMPSELQELNLKTASKLVKEGVLDSIRVSTHPLHVTPQVVARLKAFNVKTVELGIQSFSPRVLESVGRNYTPEQAKAACSMVLSAGLDLVIQLMPFLPLATQEDDLASAQIAASFSPSGVRIFPTLVLEGTDLESRFKRNEYIPATVSQAVDRVASMLEILCANGIEVPRIGLQFSRTLKAAFRGGPLHPALGELCWSELLVRTLTNAVRNHQPPTTNHDDPLSRGASEGYTIFVHPFLSSLLLGHSSAGLRSLQERLAAFGRTVQVVFGGDSALATGAVGTAKVERTTLIFAAPGKFVVEAADSLLIVRPWEDL